MGSAHLTEETLRELAERRLDARAVGEALRHLDGCAECRGRGFAYGREGLREALWGEEAGHLDFDSELVPYVDGTAGPAQREIVEGHVEDCAVCRAELEDLVEVRRGTGGTGDGRLEAGGPAGWKPALPWRALRWAVAAAVLLAGVLLGVFAIRQNKPEVQPQAVTWPAPGVTPAPPVTVPAEAPGLAEGPADARVAEALRTGQLPFPNDLDELRAEVEVVRGGEAEGLDRVSPAGIVVDDARPEFSWTARDGAWYVVSVYDGDTEVARSGRLTTAQWTPERDLRRGRTYAWQVEAHRGGEREFLPAPPALFRIVSEAGHRELADARRTRPEDHLLHAVLYAKHGLRAEALAALRAAPQTPETRRLLENHATP